MKVKKYLMFYLFCFVTLTSCTKIFYATNDSEQFKSLKIVYEYIGDCEIRYKDLNRYEKKGKIRNLNQNKNDTACVFEFELMPKSQLPLTNIMRRQDLRKMPNEERFLCVNHGTQTGVAFTCDTILFRKGQKETVNKFTERSKFFGLLGKKTYVYYFRNQ